MDRAPLSLHHLYVFAGVAAAGGVRRATDALHRASSAIARSVAALEHDLDVELFERKGRGMLLTRAGEGVLLRVQQIDALLREVREEAVRLRSRTGGTVASLESLYNERRLEAVTLLAETHHMPSVAKVLGISQSAVSQAVARLEEVLGQPLFLRTARGMIPTDVGDRWMRRFERVLAELRHITADVAALRGVLEGVVTVGALPLGRSQLLPAAITALRARHPRLHVQSLESPYEELTAGLLSGRIDLILGALRPDSAQGLAMEPLFEDRISLIAAATHPLANKRRVTLRDVEAYPWVLSRAGSPIRDAVDRFFVGQGRPAPVPFAETGDLALLRGLLQRGEAITVLSAHQLHYEIAHGMLTELNLPMPGMRRTIGIITRGGARLSPGADALIEALRTCGAAWRQ